MKKRYWLWPAVALVLAAAGAGAFSLYPRSKSEFGWLVFGPEARVRVLFRLEGEAVALRQQIDDRPTGPDQWFRDRAECTGVRITDPEGKSSYVISRMSGAVAKAGEPTEVLVHVDIEGPVAYTEYCDLVLASDPASAPTAYFHGPLTIGAQTINWQLPPDLALERGNEPTDVRALVGTMKAEERCWVVVRSETLFYRPEERRSAFPPGVHPFVEIEFPSRQPGSRIIRKRYPLDQSC